MKTCIKCVKELPLSSFYKSKKRKDGHSCYCKDCASQSVSCSRNVEQHKQSVIKRKKVLRSFVLEHLKAHPCVDCGESDPIVLDFDHVRGEKDAPISVMVLRGNSTQKIALEISKCEVRCSNCHRKVTARRNMNHWSNQ